jgi:hypothetical protein
MQLWLALQTSRRTHNQSQEKDGMELKSKSNFI